MQRTFCDECGLLIPHQSPNRTLLLQHHDRFVRLIVLDTNDDVCLECMRKVVQFGKIIQQTEGDTS